MKVLCRPADDLPLAVPLQTVKPGRVVRFDDLNGNPNYYLLNKFSPLEREFITLPEGKLMLTNLETGRVVAKPGSLMVYCTSCTAELYLTQR